MSPRQEFFFAKPYASKTEFAKEFNLQSISAGVSFAFLCINPVFFAATTAGIGLVGSAVYVGLKDSDNAAQYTTTTDSLDKYLSMFASSVRDTFLLPVFVLCVLSRLVATAIEAIQKVMADNGVNANNVNVAP